MELKIKSKKHAASTGKRKILDFFIRISISALATALMIGYFILYSYRANGGIFNIDGMTLLCIYMSGFTFYSVSKVQKEMRFFI